MKTLVRSYMFTIGAPSPKPDNEYVVYATLGGTAYLIMTNWGYPNPTYTWTHDGRTIQQHYDYGWVSMLNISNVQIEDFGTYDLAMKNDYGASYETFNLKAYGGFNHGLSFCKLYILLHIYSSK